MIPLDNSGTGMNEEKKDAAKIRPETLSSPDDQVATKPVNSVGIPTLAECSSTAPNTELNNQKSETQDSNDVAQGKMTTDKNSIRDDEEDTSDDGDISEGDEWLRRKYDDLEDRKKLAPKRVKQYRQYVNILEERVSFLEEKCDLFDKKLQLDGKRNKKTNPTAKKKRQLLKPGLGFKQWMDFTSSTAPSHVIDILVGDPQIDKYDRFRRRKAALRILEGEEPTEIGFSDDTTPDPEFNLAEEIANFKSGKFPERIRFNGKALPCILRKVFSSSKSTVPDSILLRPFKPVLQRVDHVREVMSDFSQALRRVIEKRSATQDGGNVDTSEVTEDPPPPPTHAVETDDGEEESTAPDAITLTEWDTVLKELGLFLCCSGCTQATMREWPTLTAVEASFAAMRELIDEYLLPAHKAFRDHEPKKVRFCDLWHLFLTGDTIVTKETAFQPDNTTGNRMGLKVLMTSGGRRVISPVSPAPLFGLDENPRLDQETDPPPSYSELNPFCIHAYYLDYDGSKLVPVRRGFVIPPYANARSVTDLDVFPIGYAADLRKKLLERGRKFEDYVKARPARYLDCKGTELCTREELNDKVIVDMRGYLSTTPGDIPRFDYPEAPNISEISDCPLARDCASSGRALCIHRQSRIIPDPISDVQVFTEYVEASPDFKAITGAHAGDSQGDTDFEICHYRLFAYKLRSREWVQVDVQALEEPPTTDHGSGFEKLVLPADHKQILQSQVHEHFRKRGLQVRDGNTEDDMDLVRGKGQGLIILLHGAPGVGKTCTAECIAELVMKPLYPITCGDLGSSAEDVEKNLKKHFTLASKWDCVMLLDEADVFLAKRKTEDLRRNSVVSVFLRILEYYKGLLFLTTNRVGIFDEAFKSRIHISLFYPDFDKKTTIKVWKTFIKQTQSVLESNGRTNVHINANEIKSFARKHWDENPNARWNGRQIRNAFHTAVAMAEFNARDRGEVYDVSRDAKITIGKEQFEKIAKTASEFDSYMAETIGDTFDGVATREGVRKEQPKKSESKKLKSKGKSDKKKSKSSRKESSSSSESDGDSSDERRGRKSSKKSKDRIESDATDSDEDSDE